MEAGARAGPAGGKARAGGEIGRGSIDSWVRGTQGQNPCYSDFGFVRLYHSRPGCGGKPRGSARMETSPVHARTSVRLALVGFCPGPIPVKSLHPGPVFDPRLLTRGTFPLQSQARSKCGGETRAPGDVSGGAAISLAASVLSSSQNFLARKFVVSPILRISSLV